LSIEESSAGGSLFGALFAKLDNHSQRSKVGQSPIYSKSLLTYLKRF